VGFEISSIKPGPNYPEVLSTSPTLRRASYCPCTWCMRAAEDTRTEHDRRSSFRDLTTRARAKCKIARWCAWQESNLLPLAPQASPLNPTVVLNSHIAQSLGALLTRAKLRPFRFYPVPGPRWRDQGLAHPDGAESGPVDKFPQAAVVEQRSARYDSLRSLRVDVRWSESAKIALFCSSSARS
jgi:hypothetical protein